MNWLEISIGIIFLICIITGLIRGAVRIIVSLVATIVTLVIVFFATPYVSQTIEKYTPLDDMIRQKVVSTMADAATSAVSGGDSYSDIVSRRKRCGRYADERLRPDRVRPVLG